MRAVNLLPRDSGQRQLKKESLPVLVGGCSGLLVVALLGAIGYGIAKVLDGDLDVQGWLSRSRSR